MVSSLSSLSHAQLSLGCFASGLSSSSSSLTFPVLPGLTPPYRDIYMSQGACLNYCKTNQYMYAIVEAGMACFCSSQAPPDANRVEDKWCDKPCAGYPFEMCGSALVAGDVNLAGAGVEVGGGAYANVILVGNSLAPGSATPSPSPSAAEAVVTPVSGESPEKNGSPPATTATAAAVADKGSLHPEVRNDSKSVEETNNSLGDDHDSVDEGGDDDEDNNDGGDEDGEGEDGDGDENDSEDEDQPGNSGKALSGHGKDSSTSSSKIPVASISVAVACLIGICAFLIYLGKKRKRERVRAAWVESVFGANGSSTQGGPSPGPYNNSTMNSAMTSRMMSGVSHPSAGGGGVYHQRGNNLYDDRNSMTSDSQTDRDRGGMIDRRQSTASTVAGVAATPMSAGGVGGTRRESAGSRTIHNTVMLPASAVRGSYGTTTVATPTWGVGYSNIRSPEPQQQHNDGYRYHQHQRHHSNEQYEEFFDQDEYEGDAAELSHLSINYAPGPGTVLAATPSRVQRPAVVVYSKNNKGVRTSVHPHQPGGSPFDKPTAAISSGNSNGGSGSGSGVNEYYNGDPFQDRREHLHHHQHQHQHHHHNHQQQRHSMHTSAGPGGRYRSSVVGVSDYRRPHSFSAGSHGVGGREVVDAEPRTLPYRTHVLDESSDQESIIDSEMAAVASSSKAAATGVGGEGSNSNTMGKLSGNLLKDHFKRLSTPYVKAIRDQQQYQATTPTSLSYIEEGLPHKDVDLMGGGNGYESSMPVPGLASGNERRWSRALLKGVVGVGGGGGGHRPESLGEEGGFEELSGDEQGAITRGDQGGHRHFRGHRQVHSGSLASFRGLDDPSNPRLRVMNPDDGVS
ncbi:hypothetical protein K457DRAFT_17354 [Linnemannia elongata AG-77]|uniref:WSC domain-containing protein n=1 Tax=Linnemannia elongata AG-77 TaxID=1314771 RepID=A0A197K224_9FUNG|nr:hypothetical protein K457DRAFT_17354 [Linnemannia elongata AG-77]